VGVLLALLAIALIIVAIVVLTQPASETVHLQENVVYTDLHQAASVLKQLVTENTK
jgi:hypothetical protein